MRTRWYILALLAGSLAGAGVGAWPIGPRWRSGPGAGRLEGFSPDGQVVVTSYIPPPDAAGFPDPEVKRWDAATGQLLSRVRLPCVDPQSIKAVRPSVDGGIALVGEGVPPDPTRLDFASGDWYLHDAISGSRRTGPIPGVAAIPPQAFSQDGRWFWGRRGDPHGGLDALGEALVFSAATGELVLDLLDRDGQRAGMCFFSPDGETVAVDWVTPVQPPREAQHTIQILELPSGHERRCLDLPPSKWEWFSTWDGRLFWAVERVPAEHPSPAQPGKGGLQLPVIPEPRLKFWAFDLSSGGSGEGIEQPLLAGRTVSPVVSSFWKNGPGWVAYFRLLPPEEQGTADGWWAPLMARLVVKRDPAPMRVAVRMADPASGATRYEFPHPMGYPCAVAPDGRRLACAGGGESVEVWDTDPWPRWPGAVAAGVAAAAGVLALGWRHRPAGRGPTCIKRWALRS